MRYKKPVPAKGRGQTAVPPLFAPCGASLRCTGRAPADYFPSPARLGSDLRASAIQAALQPVDRPLLGACALLLSVTGKYDYSKFGRRSQAKFAAGMVKPWRRAGKSRPGRPDGSGHWRKSAPQKMQTVRFAFCSFPQAGQIKVGALRSTENTLFPCLTKDLIFVSALLEAFP